MGTLKTGGLFACAMLLGATAAFAQNTPGQRPANAKGICKDGTYTTSTVREQACAQNGGLKEWFKPGSDSAGVDTARAHADTTHSRPSYPRPNCDTMLTGGFRCGPGDTLAPDSMRSRMHRDTASGNNGNNQYPMHSDSTRSGHDSPAVVSNDTNDQLKNRGRNPDSTTAKVDTNNTQQQNQVPADTTHARSRTSHRTTTAKCKDGTSVPRRTRTSACSSHGGVAP